MHKLQTHCALSQCIFDAMQCTFINKCHRAHCIDDITQDEIQPPRSNKLSPFIESVEQDNSKGSDVVDDASKVPSYHDHHGKSSKLGLRPDDGVGRAFNM